MKKIGIGFCFVFFLSFLDASAKVARTNDVKVTDSKAYRQRQQLCIDILLDYSELTLNAKEGLKIYPMLIGKSDTLYLPCVWLVGKIENIVPLNKRNKNKLNYHERILFDKWMHGGRLELRREQILSDKEIDQKPALFLNYIPLELKVSFFLPLPMLTNLSDSDTDGEVNSEKGPSPYSPDSITFKYQVFLAYWLDPYETKFRSNMGALALQADDWEGAHFYLDAIRKEPAGQNNWGVLLFNEGKMEEALHFFEEAYSNGYMEALYNRKQVLAALYGHSFE